MTDAFGGSDYIGTWPTPLTKEQYWNGITAAAFGDEVYNTLINSGWVTDDNKLKERVYMRVGYIKMGRGSNAAGCGGGLVTPTLGIKHNCASNVKVSFDCCIYVSGGGSWDPSTMQVRVIGPGTINDEQPPVEPIPLDVPEVAYDQEGSTASSVRFSWQAVENAARYEYTYTCLNCGEVIESRSGETASSNSAAYLYAGSIKLGTSSAVGSVFTPRVAAIDPGTKVNAEVIVGGTAFLGTNDYYDDDAAAITIEGDGTFEDGSKCVEFRMGSWNDWVRHRFVVCDITAATRFRLESRTAAKGRLFFNYLGVVKLDDAYSSASELPQLETPGSVTASEASAYGFDLSWTAVPDATDYTYYVVRPDGRTVATGKSWEPHVHIGGLDGKSVAEHPYFNVRIVANHMNYDSGKQEIPQTCRSSESSRALQVRLAESTATVYFQDDFSWIDPNDAVFATHTDWINTYCTTDVSGRFDALLEGGQTSLNGWNYDPSKPGVYTRPGYIHLNSTKTQGAIVSPALAAISGSDDVEVSFDATPRVVLGPASASSNRALFDNFRVVSLTK